jgi:hypothetical protein
MQSRTWSIPASRDFEGTLPSGTPTKGNYAASVRWQGGSSSDFQSASLFVQEFGASVSTAVAGSGCGTGLIGHSVFEFEEGRKIFNDT